MRKIVPREGICLRSMRAKPGVLINAFGALCIFCVPSSTSAKLLTSRVVAEKPLRYIGLSSGCSSISKNIPIIDSSVDVKSLWVHTHPVLILLANMRFGNEFSNFKALLAHNQILHRKVERILEVTGRLSKTYGMLFKGAVSLMKLGGRSPSIEGLDHIGVFRVEVVGLAKNNAYQEPGAFRFYDGLSIYHGGFRAGLGGLSGLPSLRQSVVHMLGHAFQGLLMALHRAPLIVGYDAQRRCRTREKQSEYREQNSTSGIDKVEKRAVLLFGSAFAFFPIILLGIKLIDSKRTRLALLVMLADLLFLGGALFLFTVTIFPWSWGWYL